MTCTITPEEIAQSVDSIRFPAILTPDQAAALLQIAKTTLYRKVSEGAFGPAVRRGKPLRFWRDRLVALFLAGSGVAAQARVGRDRYSTRAEPPIIRGVQTPSTTFLVALPHGVAAGRSGSWMF